MVQRWTWDKSPPIRMRAFKLAGIIGEKLMHREETGSGEKEKERNGMSQTERE